MPKFETIEDLLTDLVASHQTGCGSIQLLAPLPLPTFSVFTRIISSPFPSIRKSWSIY
jgi:hypothetical protein